MPRIHAGAVFHACEKAHSWRRRLRQAPVDGQSLPPCEPAATLSAQLMAVGQRRPTSRTASITWRVPFTGLPRAQPLSCRSALGLTYRAGPGGTGCAGRLRSLPGIWQVTNAFPFELVDFRASTVAGNVCPVSWWMCQLGLAPAGLIWPLVGGRSVRWG